MKHFYATLLALFTVSMMVAQCNYSLEMLDNFGDGWGNGSQISVTINGGTPQVYTVPNPPGNINTVSITVNDGDTISLDYVADSVTPGDNEFTLYDSEGIVVVTSGFSPATGNFFSGAASCPSCPAVTNITSNNVVADSAEIAWVNGGTETQWIIEYGVAPYTCGSGGTQVTASSNPFTITGLSSITTYDVYVIAVCGAMDQSACQGPIQLTTTESCPSPSNFAPVTQTANSISFVWDANGNPNPTFEVEYGPSPYTQGSGGTTVQQFTAPFADVTGLASDTSYDFYIRIDCGMGDFSLWVGPYTAQTLISCFPVSALQADFVGSDLADISWLAGQTETEWELEWALAGTITTPFSTPSQGTVVNVMTNPSTQLTGLTDDTAYDIYVRAVCDPVAPDYSSVQNISIATQCLPLAATTAMPYSEDFETFTANTDFERENCWSATFMGGTNNFSEYDWNVTTTGVTPSGGTGPDAANSGTGYMYIETLGNDGDTATLFSPIINVDGLTEPSVQFYYHLFGPNMGDLSVDVYDGTTWQTGLFTSSGQVQTAGNDPFEQAIINLAGYTGDIQVRFVSTRVGFTSGDMAIDDFSVEEAPACAPVSLLNTGVLNANDAEITWQSQGSETTWIVEYGPTGFVPGTSATDPDVFEVSVTTNPYTITGLDDTTTYDFYVTADCGMSTLSTQTGPDTFTTAFLPPSGVSCPGMDNVFVFQEEFETNDNGWTGDIGVGTTTAALWNFNRAISPGSTNTGPDAPFSGGGFAYLETSGTVTTPAEIVSPAIDLSFATDGAELSFYYFAYGAEIDEFTVNVGTSPTGPWTNEFTAIGQLQTAGSDPWAPVGVNLDAYVGQVIYLQITGKESATNGFTADIAIDLLRVETCGAFCSPPSMLAALNITDTTVDIDFADTNATAATSYEVLVQPAGDPAPDATTTGIQQTATANPYNWTGLTAFTNYDVYVRTDCMGAAGFSVWSGPISFQTACAVFTAPYSDNFEAFTASTNFLEENCWSADADGTYDWNVDDNGSTPSTGTGPLMAFSGTTYFYTEASSTGAEARLVSPIIDYSALTAPSIQFYYHMFGAQIGTLHVDVNDGTGWINDVDMIVGAQQTAQADDWIQRIVDISAITGLTGTELSVRLRAESNGTFAGDISIDDFRVDEIPTCPAPSALLVDDASITVTDATVSWTENGTATTYDVEWGPIGYTQGMPPAAPLGGSATGVTNPYTITGLQGSTQYDYYVRAICGATDTSVWVGPSTFQTLCDALPAPYFEDFETFAPPNVNFVEELCWTATSVDAYDWNVDGVGSTPSTGTGPLNANSGVNYFYTEASSGTSGTSVATLVSPLVDLSPLTTPSVEFFYHMFGGQIGTLDLEINDGTGWVNVITIGPGQIQTAQADPWASQISDLSAYASSTVQFRFVATSAGTFEGDISLDDFRVDELPACPNPSFLSVSNLTDTTADLSWTENGGSTVWTVEVQPQGVAQGTMPAAYLNAAATNAETASGLMPDTLYDFYVTSDCGAGAFSNTVGPFSFKTECAPLTAPYIEDFETFTANLDFAEENCWKGSFDSTSFTAWDWNLDDAGGTPTTNTGPNLAFNGSSYFYIEGNGGAAGNEATLLSPLVDVSTLTAPSVQFNYHMFGAVTGVLHVDVNDGSGFVNDVVLISGQQQADGNAPWELGVIDLSTFTGSVVQVRFRAERTDSGFTGTSDIALDNVVFDELPACAQPSILSSANVSDVDAEISWNENGSATSWNVEYGPCGFTPGTGTSVVATSNTGFLISGLTSETCYEFYVTADCGMGTLSGTAGPATFTTECAAVVAPYTEGFETFTVSTAFTDENCWSTPQTSGYTWDVSTNGTTSTNTGPTSAATGSNYFFTEASSGSAGDEAELLSPLIDMSALTNPALSFAYHMWGPDFDTLHIDVNDGTGWTPDVFTLVGQQQANQADAWQTAIVGLGAYTGATVQIRFRGTRGASFGGDISIDDVVVDDFNGCLTPTNVAAANITATSVDISWSAGGSETVWEYAVLPSGSGAPTGAGTSTMNTMESVSGLASSSSFEVYVRADCGMGNFSSWVGPINFATDCAPIVAPYGTATGAPGNDFTAYPGVCWSEGDDTATTVGPNGVDGAWASDDFANDATSSNGQAAKINIWNTAAINDWLVTPEFDLGTSGNFEAIFDIAHTTFAATGATAFTGDQQIQLLITDDAGLTWTAIQTWDATSPAISNTGQLETVSLSSYTGIVQLAFWGY
ncbi:thermolysin [Nonlabens ulvanivorans]|uniref:Thermolysin n=1 Tax=Nonlabens ulvanivorans TaxID=906888 RepID=A0A090QF15_NONUL|nr:fibronectin type III domain-containing protein [Nonlabens ulvanivorans]GAL00379.1 thermolysin [Nonlabens ulvanivorans]